MTPQETQFVKVLVDSGLISFKEAGHLEHAQEKVKKETGEHKAVWDIAVEEGIVTRTQASRFLQKLDLVVEAVTRASAGTADSGEYSTQNLAPAAEQIAKATAGGRRLGNYLLQSKLGQGGMGAVYKAHQESMDRTVAIKVLPRNLAKNQEFIGRFLREARSAGRLSHANIVSGIDAGFADGYYYFAMEYVEGRSLGDRLKEGPLEEDEVIRIGLQMADALEHAHEAGIVHRDVKPENILVTLGGRAKLCDLGLARGTGDDMRITQAGMAVGTPYYISPEQVQGKDPDSRADIYSLGATLYHLVTGKPPFEGDNPMAVMQKHLKDVPRRPIDVRSHGVSPALSAVIMKMMARNLASRYETMTDVAEDLKKVASGEVPAPLVGAMADRRRGSRRRGTTRGTRGARPISSRDTGGTQPLDEAGRPFPVKIAVIAVALLVLTGALVAFVVLRKNGDKPDDGGHVVQPDPEKERLKQLAADIEGIRSYEKQHVSDYGKLIERYTEFLGVAKGTKYEAEARDALSAVQRRRDADKSKERLAKLEDDLEAIVTFEKASPEAYDATIARYTTYLGGAAGTDYEAKAKSALAATQKRRKDKADTLLAALRKAVEAEENAGRFGDALAKVVAFPGAYVPVVKTELAELEKSVRAAGKSRWDGILGAAKNLASEHKYSEAKKKAEEGKALGLTEAEVWVSQALAEIEKARLMHEDEVAAEYRKKYKAFTAEFEKLIKAGRFDEAIRKGGPLEGKLGPELDEQLKADMALATGADGFIKGLRSRLKNTARGSFTVMLPMGSARFTGYDAEKDQLDFKFGAGSTAVKLADFNGEKLLDLARRAAGGRLPATEAKGAACYLLARGETGGVQELLKSAKDTGSDILALEARLATITKGAKEVEAERLLAKFDELFKAKSWQAAAMTGQRLLRDYAGTKALAARKNLASLVDQARHAGSPLKDYTVILQDGLNVGGRVYSGTRDAYISGTAREKAVNKGDAELLFALEPKFRSLVRFAVFRSDGGPLPDGAQVISARLCLFKSSSYPVGLTAYEVLKDWDESAVTSGDSGKGGAWTEAGCDGAGKDRATTATGKCELSYAKEQWAEIDVTDNLRAWSAKTRRNYGWVLIDEHEKDKTNHRKYCSREYKDDATKRPKLILKVRCRAIKGEPESRVAPAGGGFAASWQKLRIAGENPGKRLNTTTAMLYDSRRKRCVLFGGHSYPDNLNDLWSLDLSAGRWTCLQKSEKDAAGRPPGAREHHFDYDAKCDVYRLNLGWTYDPKTNAWKEPSDWTRKATATCAIRRGVAYCPDSGSFLICKWDAGTQPLGYRLVDFGTQRTTKGRADVPVRSFCDGGLVYDRACRVFVLFGGAGGKAHGDTWIFDSRSGKWREMKPATSPPPRARHNLIWHEKLRAVVLSGGAVSGAANADKVEDLWIYEASRNRWTEVKTSKSPANTKSGANATVYDAAHNVVVLLNSTCEVWALKIDRQR